MKEELESFFRSAIILRGPALIILLEAIPIRIPGPDPSSQFKINNTLCQILLLTSVAEPLRYKTVQVPTFDSYGPGSCYILYLDDKKPFNKQIVLKKSCLFKVNRSRTVV